MLLEATGLGAGIGLGASLGKSIGKGIKKAFGGKSKKSRRKKRALRAQNAQLMQENQQLRGQLQFARGALLAQPFQQRAAFAAGAGYGARMQSYANRCLNQPGALLQAQSLGATSALLAASSSVQNLASATQSLSRSIAFASANGSFNAYQLAAHQHARLLGF